MSAQPKTLLVHIGYPKSGTTTLQGTLFPKAPGMAFLGKGNGPYCAPEIDRFRALVNYGTYHHVTARAGAVAEDIRALWAASGQEVALMSLEGLTNPFADTHYTQPKDTFRKMSDMARILAPLREAGVTVRVFATLRDQVAMLPSLFSQIYLHGFATGLYGNSYPSFLDFMLGDDVLGFGPEFFFDALLDHLGDLFGQEHIYAAVMGGLLAGKPCRETAAAAAFLGLPEEEVITLIGTEQKNARKGSAGRKIMTRSAGIDRFEAMTGLPLKRAAFGMSDRLKLARHKRVVWDMPDESARIRDYYAASNARLKERYDIAL